MITDAQGYPLAGATGDAAAHYQQAVEAFNIYRGDPVASVDAAMEAAPGFAMAPVLKAYLLALATEPGANAEARSLVSHAATLGPDDRVGSHLNALSVLLEGDWTAAAVALDVHNARYPLDLVALQCGHLMDFYRGNARNLRDRIARVRPYWSAEVPGYSLVVGMHAFGLEESADYARAEDAGREALDREPLDCWAHHAVAHVMEMQGRAEDGIGWMRAREPHWSGDDNFFSVHNWWHLALCHLNLGDAEQALALYDGPIRAARSDVALDMVDASSLLWRLQLTGHDVGDRWRELAEAWDQHADGCTYPFNDWHGVMAYLGADREPDVARVLDALRVHAGTPAETGSWARDIAMPLVEGFTAFWHGNHARAVELLHPVRYAANRFGGSHAQRDIIDWTLTESAVRGGLADLAQALIAERLASRPHAPVNRHLLARAGGPGAAGTPTG